MASSGDGKPRVLVLGGCGFIGRNLVKHLVDKDLASFIKVADKSMPMTSYMAADHKAAFDAPHVAFKQSDLTREQHVERAFADEGGAFDYVFNLCGETRCGLAEGDYKSKNVDSAVLCSRAAAAQGVKKFVEVSSAQIYDSGKNDSAEDGKVAPWTLQAQYRFKAEEELRAVQGLPLVVLRPALVYGPGDLTSLTPRLACAAVYKRDKKKMKFLWSKDLRLSVVHVQDVCAALWLAATAVDAGKVYNVAEPTKLDQGKLAMMIGSVFKIDTGFLGGLISRMASLNLSGIADNANEEHLPGFVNLCREQKVDNTPVSPYVDAELLRNNHYAVDGTAIAKEVPGFAYTKSFSEQEMRDQIKFFVDAGYFPDII